MPDGEMPSHDRRAEVVELFTQPDVDVLVGNHIELYQRLGRLSEKLTELTAAHQSCVADLIASASTLHDAGVDIEAILAAKQHGQARYEPGETAL